MRRAGINLAVTMSVRKELTMPADDWLTKEINASLTMDVYFLFTLVIARSVATKQSSPFLRVALDCFVALWAPRNDGGENCVL
jgi:hypothetical protein